MKNIVLILGILLSSCDTLFTGSRELGIPIALVIIDKKPNAYVFRRYDFKEVGVENRLVLTPVGTGSEFVATPIGLQVSQSGNRVYVGLNDKILFYTDASIITNTIVPPQSSGQICTIENFRVNDAETYLAALVNCGDTQNLNRQKLWVRSLTQGGREALIDNPIPNDQPIAVTEGPFIQDTGNFPYALTRDKLYFIKNVIGDSNSSLLYILPLNADPLELPSGYLPEKIVAVNTLGSVSLSLDSGQPIVGGLAATRDGIYRIEDNGKLGIGKLLPELYRSLWNVSTSALKSVALWNPDLNVNFNRTLRFYNGSSNPVVNTQGRVRDLTFSSVTGNAYYLDASSLVQVDVSSIPVNNTYQTLSQDYASLELENPVSIGWILKP